MKFSKFVRKQKIFSKKRLQRPQIEFCNTLHLGMDGNKILLDEADVAYCKSIYERMGGGQGKRIFNGDGTPFTPKPPRRKPRMTHASAIA
jgi:hypothetical protein